MLQCDKLLRDQRSKQQEQVTGCDINSAQSSSDILTRNQQQNRAILKEMQKEKKEENQQKKWPNVLQK